MQAIHGDVTDDNVVGRRDEAGRVRPDGIIDFGDLARSWLVADLAVTCASVLRHHPDDPFSILPAVRAFHSVVPLDDADLEALWPLVVLRGAVLVASGEHQAMLDPDNDSATGPLESEWRIFHTAHSVPCDLAEATVRAALGLGAPARLRPALDAVRAGGRLFPSVDEIAVVDLSVSSDDLHSGRFLSVATEREVLHSAATYGAAATRHAEARLTRTALDSVAQPETFALGVDLVLPVGTEAVAPWDVVVADVDGSVVRVDSAAGRLCLTGLRPRSPRATPSLRARSSASSAAATCTCGFASTRRSTPRSSRPPPPCPAGPCSVPTRRRCSASTCPCRAPTRSSCSDAATRSSPGCRSTTTPSRCASSAGGATTCSTPTGAPTSTWSTTSPRSATATHGSPTPSSGRCACSTPTRASTTPPSRSSPSGWRPSRPRGSTRSSWSTADRRRSTSRFASRRRPPRDRTSSRSARPTTAGPCSPTP